MKKSICYFWFLALVIAPSSTSATDTNTTEGGFIDTITDPINVLKYKRLVKEAQKDLENKEMHLQELKKERDLLQLTFDDFADSDSMQERKKLKLKLHTYNKYDIPNAELAISKQEKRIEHVQKELKKRQEHAALAAAAVLAVPIAIKGGLHVKELHRRGHFSKAYKPLGQ